MAFIIIRVTQRRNVLSRASAALVLVPMLIRLIRPTLIIQKRQKQLQLKDHRLISPKLYNLYKKLRNLTKLKNDITPKPMTSEMQKYEIE